MQEVKHLIHPETELDQISIYLSLYNINIQQQSDETTAYVAGFAECCNESFATTSFIS